MPVIGLNYKEVRGYLLQSATLRERVKVILGKLGRLVDGKLLIPEELVHYSEWVHVMRHRIAERQTIDVSHIRATVHPACHVYKMVPQDVIYDNDVLDGNRVAVSTGIMEALGYRKGDLVDMVSDGRGRVRLEYRVPARGLIGFQGEFMNLTRGNGLMSHVFDEYAPVKDGSLAERRNGVLISQDNGEAVAYALWKLQDRGRMFVSPGDKLYEGMIIGIHSRENDLVVNPIKGKQLTNVRASGTDEAVRLVPPVQLSLEAAVEFIDEDELVELTPKSIRLRKRYLTEIERKRAVRGL